MTRNVEQQVYLEGCEFMKVGSKESGAADGLHEVF